MGNPVQSPEGRNLDGQAISGGFAMPVHDWSRVGAGTFHDFHCGWIVEIRNALNNGLLPTDHYAMAEQIVGNLGPDVLTLQVIGPDGGGAAGEVRGATAVSLAPPKVRFTATTERVYEKPDSPYNTA
jgi:hypothetical protein